MSSTPAIALVPVPPALSGMSYRAARKALKDPRVRAAVKADPAGTEFSRWACEWSATQAHAELLAVVAAAVAAAVQAGKMTPAIAWSRLDTAVAIGHKSAFVSFDDGYDQADPPETRSDTDTFHAIDALDAILKAATEMTLPVDLPSCVEVVRQAALTAAGLLPSGVALAGLVAMDHDAQVCVLRRLQRNWPTTIPPPAMFIVSGSAQRTTTRDDGYGVILGPLSYLLAWGHTSGLPKTAYQRWESWGRKLSPALAT